MARSGTWRFTSSCGRCDDVALRALSICAGIGGLDLGLAEWCRTVCYIERDAFAASVLVARMEDAALDRAPIWDDLATFDGRPWRGRVDLVAAGIPCQPFSVAGKQRGLEDERWLWDDLLRILDETAAPALFLENVPGFVRHGLGRVLTDLAARGFDAEWDLFSASDLGAPHRRERFFLLADSGDGLVSLAQRGPEGRDGARPAGTGMAHANGAGCSGQRIAERAGIEGSRGSVALGCRDDGRLAWPPGPADADGWRDWIAAGGPPPAVERGLRGDVARTPARVDRLRALGNAVVPAQAALAFRELAGRMK